MASEHQILPVHPVNITVLPAKGRREKLTPNADERAQIARHCEILSLESLEADILFKRWRKNGVSVTGTVNATVVQECVVTLEPVTSSITEDIDRTFLPEGSKLLRPQLSGDGELVVDYDGRDEPEAFVGDTLDAWEIVLEHFQLGLDPFPRTPGVEFTSVTEDDGAGPEKGEKSPFAALKNLLDGDE